MATVYAIERIIKMVETEEAKIYRELMKLERSSTFFKRFAHEKSACKSKMNFLNEIKSKLIGELRKANMMEEIES